METTNVAKISITLKKGKIPEFKFEGDLVGSDIMLIRSFLGKAYKKWKMSQIKKEK